MVPAGLVVGLLVAGCGGEDSPKPEPDRAAESSPVSSPSVPAEPQTLRQELLAMMAEDQREQKGGGPLDDTARVARLKEIIAEHGWPTFDLVGRRGEEAAWVIAQHADLDLAFQRRALHLLRAAVAVGQASPGNLAYLEDRVAVAEGRPQTYGTQIRCDRGGEPAPATPIAEPDRVEQRRSRAGLEPLSDYLAEMRDLCATAP